MKNHEGMRVRHEDGRVGMLLKRTARDRGWLVKVGGFLQWWPDPAFTEYRTPEA